TRLPPQRGGASRDQLPRDLDQYFLRDFYGPVLSSRYKGGKRTGVSWTVCRRILLCAWNRALRDSGGLSVHEEAPHPADPGQHVRILQREVGLAFLGHRWRGHLVHGDGIQYRGLSRTGRRSGRVVCDWPGCNHGLCALGRLYLEGIRKRAAAFTQIYSGDVRLLLTWSGFDRNRTHGHAIRVRSLDAEVYCCGRERQP